MHVLWGVRTETTAAAAGTALAVPAGSYTLTVRGEPIWIKLGASIAGNEGTYLAVNTQWLVDVPSDETWSIRSPGATGILEVTRVA